jgi:hypothetical protein
VQLGKSDQRGQVALIRFERRLKRRSFTLVIAGEAVSLGKVQP